MDTLTHALSGVLLAECAGRRADARSHRARLTAAAVAAAFPDIDYALVLLDPLEFLVWHRGPTHSLVLLPLWAMLLALPLGRMLHLRWRVTAAACAVGLLAHVVGDWVTLYGTRLAYPLAERAYALGISFDVNPWIALIVIAGFVLGRFWRPRPVAVATLALVGAWLAGQAVMRQQALSVAAEQAPALGVEVQAIQALPQPLSPFHWALLLSTAQGYHLAYLDLLGGVTPAAPAAAPLLQMPGAYRGRRDLTWTRHARPDSHSLTGEAWAQPALAPFRRFARSPVLLGIEHEERATCVWFTDLRYRLPALAAPFRYGLCRPPGGREWRPYWIRILTADTRQAL